MQSVLILYNGPPYFPSKLPLSLEESKPHLTHGSTRPPESLTQTASRSVQPFYMVHYCDRQTDRHTDRQQSVIITSSQNNSTKGRIAAAHGQFYGIPQVAPESPHLIRASLGPSESTTHTASWSVQPFLRSSRTVVSPCNFQWTALSPRLLFRKFSKRHSHLQCMRTVASCFNYLSSFISFRMAEFSSSTQSFAFRYSLPTQARNVPIPLSSFDISRFYFSFSFYIQCSWNFIVNPLMDIALSYSPGQILCLWPTLKHLIYTVEHKNVAVNLCQQLYQILTDFQNSFIIRLCDIFANVTVKDPTTSYTHCYPTLWNMSSRNRHAQELPKESVKKLPRKIQTAIQDSASRWKL